MIENNEPNLNPNPNMNDNKSQDYTKLVDVDPTKITIEKNPKTIVSNFISFISHTLSIRDGVIKFAEVVKDTKESAIFKGYNVWILVCSIIIASVGLNVDSTAVIIGAMLISPLMGPIRGIGFGVGTNNLSLIKLSLKNMGITVAVSLVTSYLYFLITPIDQLTNQLFLRTEPNFLDVIIAFVGGLAGVIAAVKGKNDTVIPGVAIATALMPPLCTAGYGLANGEWNFFFGASYLFLINSVLITLSTIIVVRYLNFPKQKYVDSKIERKVKTSIIVFMLVILAPSTYLFYTMIQKTVFENKADEFVNNVIKNGTEGTIDYDTGYSIDSCYINIKISGGYAGADMITSWNKLKENYDLKDATLKIYQGANIEHLENKLNNLEQNGVFNKEVISIINEKDKQINQLAEKYELLKTQSTAKDPMDFDYVLNTFKIDYPELKSVRISRNFSMSLSQTVDTTYMMFIQFNDSIPLPTKNSLKHKLRKKITFVLKEKTHTKQDSIPVYVIK